jgi:spermidine/putrescine transport system permease protein
VGRDLQSGLGRRVSRTLDPVSVEPTGEPPGSPVAREGGRVLERRRRVVAYGLLTPGALYLVLTFVLPLLLVVYTSLKSGGLLSGGGFTFTGEFGNYPDMLEQYGSFFVRSIWYAGIATMIAILVAYPMAYWIAFYGGRWKSTLFFLILVPFFVSFVVRTVQWKFILGDNGLIFAPLKHLGILPDDFRVLATPFAVVAGITYNFLPFTALPLYVALERIDRRLVEAAKDLYANKFEAFRKVVLPLSVPGIFAAVILTFVPATGDYINSEVLGNPSTTMIGQIIQQKFLTELNYPDAAALSVILMVGMLILALIYAKILGTEDEALAAGAAT